MVAWHKCTKPKKKGGLGIINLRSQNIALQLKHLHKFFNKKDIPWVRLIWNTYYNEGKLPQSSKEKGSFWWKDVLKLCDLYRGIAKCVVGNGSTALFWNDIWNDRLLHQSFPRLYAYAKNKSMSVRNFMSLQNTSQHFHLPLSSQAHQEYMQLQQIIRGGTLILNEDHKDTWIYQWGTASYTSSKFYYYTLRQLQPPQTFIWLWDSKCSNKLTESLSGFFSWID